MKEEDKLILNQILYLINKLNKSIDYTRISLIGSHGEVNNPQKTPSTK
jgi:hypothetical protein